MNKLLTTAVLVAGMILAFAGCEFNKEEILDVVQDVQSEVRDVVGELPDEVDEINEDLHDIKDDLQD